MKYYHTLEELFEKLRIQFNWSIRSTTDVCTTTMVRSYITFNKISDDDEFLIDEVYIPLIKRFDTKGRMMWNIDEMFFKTEYEVVEYLMTEYFYDNNILWDEPGEILLYKI